MKSKSRFRQSIKGRFFWGVNVSFLSLMICILLLGSCIPYNNTILIRKKLETKPSDSLGRLSTYPKEYTVNPEDVLAINISSFNPEITQFFNEKKGVYPVRENGHIYMPVLDSIKVAGKTIEEIRKNLTYAVRKYSSDAFVSVSLDNFNITILGEVRSPGIKKVISDRLTILEVMGLAGDVTDFGNRKKVKLIRKVGDDVSIALLDITNESIVSSEYFYLLPGDVIYVQPLYQKNLVFNYRQILAISGVFTAAFLVLRISQLLQ